jgi:DNA-binding NtrC family response regulator
MADVVAFPLKSKQRQLILIVSDELVTQTMLSERLRENGFQTAGLSNPTDAFRLLKLRVPIDLVFFDLRSALEGYGVAHWMLVNSPETPLILAHEQAGEMAVAAQLCGAEICSTPHDADAVVKKIGAFLRCVRAYDRR